MIQEQPQSRWSLSSLNIEGRHTSRGSHYTIDSSRHLQASVERGFHPQTSEEHFDWLLCRQQFLLRNVFMLR